MRGFAKVLGIVQGERTFPFRSIALATLIIALLQGNILLFPTIFTFGCHMDES
jgi:hypothetical protein